MNETAMTAGSDMEPTSPNIEVDVASTSDQATHAGLNDKAEASNGHGAKDLLKQTAGIRLAHRSVVSWYHGGINE